MLYVGLFTVYTLITVNSSYHQQPNFKVECNSQVSKQLVFLTQVINMLCDMSCCKCTSCSQSVCDYIIIFYIFCYYYHCHYN